MSAGHDPFRLPPDLPVPVDEGACDHLTGVTFPACALRATTGEIVDLAVESHDAHVVVYFYPRTGRPGIDPPAGWDAIPGARGCTPQSCAFRDHHDEFRALGARVFGLSTQGIEEQQEFAARTALTFPLLSDPELRLAERLAMPTFDFHGRRYYRRVTLVVADERIEKVFYPVFPPDENAEHVLAWLTLTLS